MTPHTLPNKNKPLKEKRIALYGGSFNPPHYSHFFAAAWALCSGEVDEVWMIPCAEHAFGKALAPFHHRAEMCKLGASALSKRIRVNEIESTLPPPNYTLYTIQHLQALHPDHRFRLLVGADILNETHAWHQFDRVIALAPLLVIGRIGVAGTESYTIQLPPLSSTTIRQRLGAGEDVSEFLPGPVLDYIQKNGLYQHPQTG
jgi:nicotinate-nucleotide adenylyltransferase